METMRWADGCLEILDQTKLPGKVEYINCTEHRTVCEAIKRLSVRGAPAIGAAAAYGLALGAASVNAGTRKEFLTAVEDIAAELAATRPTAVNLKWAVDRILAKLKNCDCQAVNELKALLVREADDIYNEDLASNKKMGEFGRELVPDNAAILTHCNAGALATAGLGTALGVIRAARDAGKKVSVYADETRPLLQGARLTAWEMLQENIPVTLISDNMAGYLMSLGKVNLVIVGADRITANGDVANKIGTYGVAVLAKEHNVPFYVAAPMSTIDFNLASGKDIPIEERAAGEITHFAGIRVAPEGVGVWNPAFDVTPARLISAIITDRGVAKPPYGQSLAKLRLP
ncbi:methylthioribose-1-phosphate isomerase [Desulfotomaculum arcticum]|uniref:Methylthioribose-1-phosphate isomerase n=1 Tax=Desulfotruncus arcticus DSM 17038 TaxID=1121424 RepID=A0A1I2RGW9_9FIRM|nr:S-methyl-5-thioribose-1-phosphate isomerase [Desulfotruncus arcticus]SFG39732.1 methylthioribose-1-phosphate isomerase [Desulfotomaculum arcticum] [Desulfotruncus arcticus DSM 17038]